MIFVDFVRAREHIIEVASKPSKFGVVGGHAFSGVIQFGEVPGYNVGALAPVLLVDLRNAPGLIFGRRQTRKQACAYSQDFSPQISPSPLHLCYLLHRQYRMKAMATQLTITLSASTTN